MGCMDNSKAKKNHRYVKVGVEKSRSEISNKDRRAVAAKIRGAKPSYGKIPGGSICLDE